MSRLGRVFGDEEEEYAATTRCVLVRFRLRVRRVRTLAGRLGLRVQREIRDGVAAFRLGPGEERRGDFLPDGNGYAWWTVESRGRTWEGSRGPAVHRGESSAGRRLWAGISMCVDWPRFWILRFLASLDTRRRH